MSVYRIEMREHKVYDLQCKECGKSFEAGRIDAMYCSPRCKHSAWTIRKTEAAGLDRGASEVSK